MGNPIIRVQINVDEAFVREASVLQIREVFAGINSTLETLHRFGVLDRMIQSGTLTTARTKTKRGKSKSPKRAPKQ